MSSMNAVKQQAPSGWIEIGALDDIPRQGARVVRANGGDIAVFRTLEDEVFALRDRYRHGCRSGRGLRRALPGASGGRANLACSDAGRG